jgi:hypothetical protein
LGGFPDERPPLTQALGIPENMWPFKKPSEKTEKSSLDDRWPTFAGKTAIAKWVDSNKAHQVFLLKREDGLFSIWAERAEVHECEVCGKEPYWGPTQYGSFYDSRETAIAEIHAMHQWTVGITPELRDA